MKKKNILFLIFTLIISVFAFKVEASTLKYELKDTSNNPLTCVYKSSQNTGKYYLVLENGKFNLYSMIIDGNPLNANIDLKTFKTEKGCPKEIEMSMSANSTTIKVTGKAEKSKKYVCGSGEGMVTGIPKKIPQLTSFAVNLIQIAIPIILIILGSIDLFKGITAGKEDEMKKGQQLFIKRLIVGAIIFLVPIIIRFFISIVADTNEDNIFDCMECFISNDCTEEEI